MDDFDQSINHFAYIYRKLQRVQGDSLKCKFVLLPVSVRALFKTVDIFNLSKTFCGINKGYLVFVIPS